MIAEVASLMADMLEDMLVQSGYEDSPALPLQVEEGVELGDRCKPDLAVLDIRLAEGGLGMDIAARMQSRDGLGILYASGNSGQMGLTKDDGEASFANRTGLRTSFVALKLSNRSPIPARRRDHSQKGSTCWKVLRPRAAQNPILPMKGRRDQATSSTAGGACGIRQLRSRRTRSRQSVDGSSPCLCSRSWRFLSARSAVSDLRRTISSLRQGSAGMRGWLATSFRGPMRVHRKVVPSSPESR